METSGEEPPPNEEVYATVCGDTLWAMLSQGGAALLWQLHLPTRVW
jgi:hypothetical protein